MQHRRGGGGAGLRTASLVAVACLIFLGTGFYVGRYVGLNSNKSTSTSPVVATAAPATAAARPAATPTGTAPVTKAAGGSEVAAGTSARGSSSLGGSNSSPSKAGAAVSSLPATPPVFWPSEGSSTGQKPICHDTCPKARNGVCNEGRVRDKNGAHQLVLCDLGTDCADCGPWTPTVANVPWRKDGRGGPVSRLIARKVEVRVKTVVLPGLDFVFAYTDPTKDVDVSASMQGNGHVEMEISKVFHTIFKSGCRADSRKRGLFLDVGSNFGWYSVMAASMGCRSVAFEPVPDFHAFLEYNLHVNNLAHLVDVRKLIVSSETGVELTMTVPSHGIWGTAGIGGLNIDRAIGGTHELISVQSVRVDELVREEVLLMKMDVEGWEFSVFEGATNLILQHGVENIILEYSPGVHERNFKVKELKSTIDMLVSMVAFNYSIAHIPDRGPAAGTATFPFEDPNLPAMKEVTGHNLLYDMHDYDEYKNNLLSCPRYKEVTAINSHGAWGSCNSVPEDLSPRSLHSVMGHNTNLWGSKKRSMMPLDGPVGLVPLLAPATQYFPDKGAVWGLGRRLCGTIPFFVQVRHRCECGNATVCAAEEAAMRRLSAEGAKWINSNYLLPAPTP